jgi:hypothetical protein
MAALYGLFDGGVVFGPLFSPPGCESSCDDWVDGSFFGLRAWRRLRVQAHAQVVILLP